jgi:hypothetical protein
MAITNKKINIMKRYPLNIPKSFQWSYLITNKNWMRTNNPIKKNIEEIWSSSTNQANVKGWVRKKNQF